MGAPDLAGLPGWAQVVGYALFAASVAIIGVMTRFGWKMGKAGPSSGSEKGSATVAAVIVDPEALNRASAAVLKLEATMGRLTDVVGQHVADQREERHEREIDEEVNRQVAEALRLRRPRRPRVKKPAN